jgi:sulfatase modifying factor 1
MNRRSWGRRARGSLAARASTLMITSAVIWIALVAPSRASDAATADPLEHSWERMDGKHWQIKSTVVEDVALTDAVEKNRGPCGAGMVEVRGDAKVDGWGYADGVEALQKTACVDWISRKYPERCARFDESRWLAASRSLRTTPMKFCIDRFEYPDRRGAYPWILVSWTDAEELCARNGRRLCTEEEWTFACEGEAALPYPYGYARDADACVVDKPAREVDEDALASNDTHRQVAELDRLWQGEASGTRPRCRSPFGVYDMTGNVDEWSTSMVRGERPSILNTTVAAFLAHGSCLSDG